MEKRGRKDETGGRLPGDEDGMMAVSWRQRQEERWEMEDNSIKVFFIIRTGAQSPALSGKVKESDEHVVMLNDDMMNTGGTGQQRHSSAGSKTRDS